MEKISAACAMDWSIELEKGLRSRKPGHLINSINSIGPRLEQWSKEPQPTLPMYNMYCLVPGEDRLYADAILLRLIDTFVSGDRDTKISVVKVLMSIVRHGRRKDGQPHGIFSNMGKENSLELLKRIKAVVTAESIELRALALILFGCFAELAKNVATIRHAILSALFSCHGLEVKASLFAARCFSEISDDFGSVFLESLLKLMNSPKTLPALIITGARTFSKMGCSVLLAMKSYKAGAEIVRKTSEEDILATMLMSLTKLSLKVSILISDQIGLLSSFLAQNTSSCLRDTVLRCMRNIVEESACFLPIGAVSFQNLFKILDEPTLPSASRCDVLHIFSKLLAYGLPDMFFTDIDEFMKLLRYVEDATHSPIFSARLLAFQILVSISDKLKGRKELVLEVNPVSFPTRVVSTISDQITQMVRLVLDGISSSEVAKELGSMFKLLLLLAENHPELGSTILDKLYLVVKDVANSQNLPSSAKHDSEVHKVVNTGAKQNCSLHFLLVYICRFLVAFREILDDFGAITDEIACKLKQLVSFVCDSNLFDCSIHTSFALFLCSLIKRNHLPSNYVQGLNGSPSKFLESEALIHLCAKNMLAGGDNWCAYKAGRYAACEGEWDVANFIFQHLEEKVQSEFCCKWLNFLAYFTYTEKNVKVLLQKASWYLPMEHALAPSDVNKHIEKLIDALDHKSSSDKFLEAISLQTQTLCFQRWFVALREKVLLLSVDILKLLNGCLVSKVGLESNMLTGGSDVTDWGPVFQTMKETTSSLVEVSARLASVAEEYDLISSSFADIDSKSFNAISALAFGCSVLAFCADFANWTPNLFVFGDLTKESSYCQSVIIKDLAVRLWHMDSEIAKDLMSILKEYEVHERSLHFLPTLGISNVNHVSEHIFTLCRSSVKQLIGLRNECVCVENEDLVWQVYKDRIRLLLSIVEAWMLIPFRVPNYFFRVRPTVGSLLISLSAGSDRKNEISVSQGSHLALNLCIQLKNLTSEVCSRFSKIHCILSCKAFLETRRNGQSGGEGWTIYQASETDTLIDLNKKLQCHVMKQAREFMNCRDHQIEGETTETCVCFNTNGTAQGFSTCLLDVSAFPVGFYRIHWYCGGVDHQGAFRSFLPLSPCPHFRVIESSSGR